MFIYYPYFMGDRYMEYNTYYKSSRPKKAGRRQDAIISILSSKNLSMEDLLDALKEKGIPSSEPSIKKDIFSLREKGYDIVRSKHLITLNNPGHTAQLSISNFDSSRTPSYILQFLLLEILSNKCLTLQEIHESNPLFNTVSEYDLRCNILGPLLENNLVEKVPGTWKYRNCHKYVIEKLPQNESIILSLLDSKHDFPVSICKTAIKALEYRSNYYIANKKEISTFYKISDYLSHLQKVNYSKNPIRFEYLSSKGNIETVNYFYIGLIAYSADKDELYIIGSSKISRPKFEMFSSSSIKWDSLKISDNINNFKKIATKEYINSLRKEFSSIKEEMFDISCDKPQSISIKIKASSKNIKEFEHLSASRSKTSSLKYVYEDGNSYLVKQLKSNYKIEYLLYKDTIRGIGDFAKYLRGFGDSIVVLSDEKLKSQLISTADRVIENYKHLENI